MTAITREAAITAMTKHYPQARKQLADAGAFGKDLDRKARKLALRLAGVELPEGFTIAWATPDDWAADGYRKPGKPASLDAGERVNVYLDAASLKRAAELGNGNVSDGIRLALKA